MRIEFLLPAILFLLCLGIRAAYEFLKEARRINPESKPIFVVILVAMCLLWMSWFNMCPADPFSLDFPDPIRWMGFAIIAAGSVLAVGALIRLRGLENIDHLVTTGLFKKLRHPMYVGFMFWIIGWSVYHGAIAGFGIGLVGIASVLWWSHLEETRLETQFGTAYQQYRLTTCF